MALRVAGLPDPLGAATLAGPLPPVPGPNDPSMPGGQPWRGDLPAGLSRVRFFDARGGWRPVHPDPALDVGLAVLTACDLRSPPRADVLEAVSADAEADPLLR